MGRRPEKLVGVCRELPRQARVELEAKKEALAQTREALETRTHDLQDKEYDLKKVRHGACCT